MCSSFTITSLNILVTSTLYQKLLTTVHLLDRLD